MVGALMKAILGTKNEREINRIRPLVARVNEIEPQMKAQSDDELRSLTAALKERISRATADRFAGRSDADPAEIYKFEQGLLEELLPEAFAAVREAGVRALGMRHFDVQLVGGVVLHRGRISEMKTGEGKTLVATLAAYLNALSGRGVHIVTVNDYLAARDSEWMGRIYRFLGLSVGVIVHGLNDAERKAAYACDITYGHNSEVGFDYLRDNMKFRLEDYVQREHHYAIVDEVDCILIDEARTPLIISGPSEESSDLYYKINGIIPYLKPSPSAEEDVREINDYFVDEKARNAILTDKGVEKTEKLLGVRNLYEPQNIEILHHVQQALKAHTVFHRDRDYVVKDGQVMIVDDFTGRIMEGRRWSDGLHQAIEAKEGVRIESENQTLATITYQNYFRLYRKLAGMTGTADTEAEEFAKIYKLDVNVVPTNQPMIRTDHQDQIYKTEREKFNAVADEIQDCHDRGQPVLVGTISIEKSERVSDLLKKRGIPHEVLNAKHHEREAAIVAQAGRHRQVTIATNMAGRGTDILLGGNPEFLARLETDASSEPEKYAAALSAHKAACEDEKKLVIDAGGLHILGTERHESRRIDNQLRGRAGRQGDPGTSRFYLSLEDDLMRIFGSDRVARIMDLVGMEEGQPIEHGMVSRAIEGAQKKVEGHHFEMRKHLLDYDDVMNQQRKTIYDLRRKVLGGKEIRDRVLDLADEYAGLVVDTFCPPDEKREDWNVQGLEDRASETFGIRIPLAHAGTDREKMMELIYYAAEQRYGEREHEIGADTMRKLEQFIYLQTIDSQWMDHLLAMDHLREGIGLRGYGQKDPKLEYKKEGYSLFVGMMDRIREEVLMKLFRVQIAAEKEEDKKVEVEQFRPKQRQMFAGAPDKAEPPKSEPIRKGAKVGRNDPCPCGSGKKYKKYCLARDEASGKA
ncbi:MAG: preprotein translocase subunit SecA [Deltaproteobacteria bacterium]|nr:preprotein translocase subunit SecA [Deltaproteobacteria bacterium]